MGLVAVAVFAGDVPRVERGALGGADAVKRLDALLTRGGVVQQVGAHACVVEPGCTAHADAPLRLHGAPVAPGIDIARPEPNHFVINHGCAIATRARDREQGREDGVCTVCGCELFMGGGLGVFGYGAGNRC
mgnify:CR=1 FL=1